MRLIDGDALKRKAQKVAAESCKMQMTAKVETVLNQFIDWIENAPTIDAAPVVHGRWIRVGNHWKCSVCEKDDYSAYFWGADTMELQDFYCPNCGAKVDGSEADAPDRC